MAPKRKGQPSLAAQLLPTLAKPASAVGAFVEIQGCEWNGCPAADKEKWFKCIVRQFEAVHEFPGSNKSAGFQVQEMGESGEGSLEPGVASGDVFWVVYPNPFLKYYYKANPDKLPDGHRDKPVNAVVPVAAAPAAAAPAAATQAAATASPTAAMTVPNGLPMVKQEAPVYGFFTLESDELCCKPGANHGKRQQVWRCAVVCDNGELCACKRTLTFTKVSQAPANSNLGAHLRDEASKCSKHAAAVKQLNESSKNQILQADGSYTTIFSFEEAFPHHVDYVMCVAKGEISAVTGKKPMFRKFVRGAPPFLPPLHPPSLRPPPPSTLHP